MNFIAFMSISTGSVLKGAKITANETYFRTMSLTWLLWGLPYEALLRDNETNALSSDPTVTNRMIIETWS